MTYIIKTLTAKTTLNQREIDVVAKGIWEATNTIHRTPEQQNLIKVFCSLITA